MAYSASCWLIKPNRTRITVTVDGILAAEATYDGIIAVFMHSKDVRI